jgi:hypothetical protein
MTCSTRRVQQTVGTEFQPAAVVNRRGWNSVEEHGALAQPSSGFAIAFDAVDGPAA